MELTHKLLSIACCGMFMTCASAALAQSETASPGVFTCSTDDGRQVTITVINDNILKVSNLEKGESIPVSQSVIIAPEDFNGNSTESEDFLTIKTPTGVSAIVNKNSGAVLIEANNKRFIYDNGQRWGSDDRRYIKLFTNGDCSYYGAGERGYSYNLAGDTLVMYNKQNYGYKKGEERIKQMNITMPMFYSTNGYAVLFDDYAAAEMIMGQPIEYISESPEPVSYYFINGGQTLAETVNRFTGMVGRQELPPFWSMGYITSKYGYKTAKETVGVIDTLKMKGYPVDGVVLDLYWYGKEQDMGRLEWEPEQWQDHTKMLSRLKKKGVNTVIISQPYVLTNGKALDNYNELSAKGMFCRDSVGKTHDVTIWVGQGGMFDVSNPDTRQWLRDRYKKLTDEGVGGWWGDLGEPEVHPESIFHHNGLTARQYHNLYGNDWSRIIYDLYKEEYPETRLMTLMRGGTVGLQRYSVFPWSTDVSRSWGGLQPQVTIMLNSGLSGLGYMSHDVGGFAITEDYVVDPELYVRWLQLGTFSPVLRTHAQQVAEPYRYPEQQDIILDLIKTRYQWLPYNYSIAADNAMRGYPLVRPLNFYSNSDKYDDIEDQYLWGPQVMVAPVLEKGATSRRIVFPQYGRQWWDYNNPTMKYQSGDTIEYSAPLNVLPLFVKAGAIIAQADYKMGNTGDYRTDRYTLKVFPGSGSMNTYLYEDDRKSPNALKDKQFNYIQMTTDCATDQMTVTLTCSGNGYKGAPAKKDLDFIVYGMTQRPKSVVVDGKALKAGDIKYDDKTQSIKFAMKWIVADEAEIIINK